MKKLNFIAFSILFFLSGCFASVSFPVSLSCEDAVNAMNSITPATKILLEGIRSQQYTNEFVKFCKTHTVRSLHECTSFPKDRYEDCMRSLGIQTDDRTLCGSDKDCLVGYAVAHPGENCSLYDKPFLKNICFYTQSYFSHSRKYCDFIEIKTWKDGPCKEMTKTLDDQEILRTCYTNRYKCLWGVSDWTDDVDICNSMEDSFEKDICYMIHAIKKSDKTLCDKMKGLDYGTKGIIERCREAVGQPLPEKYRENGLLGTTDF